MFNYSISALIFLLLIAIGLVVCAIVGAVGYTTAAVLLFILWVPFDFLISSSVRMAAQWERAVVFRLGRYKDMRGPGLFLVWPVIEQVRMIDTRVISVNIPKQQVITRDNVPVTTDAVLFFRVSNAAEAIISVQDFRFAVSNYAQTSLRDVIGQMTLDQLLTEREEIAHAIEQHVVKDTKGWGIEITGLRIQDIDMPEELKKMMSRQASAEREKRATITKAEGDKEAAFNLAAAARTMAESPGAMMLRTLQTVDGLGPSASNTVVFAVPIEILEALKGIKGIGTSTTLADSNGPATLAQG
jgi:regulator of protease activity HflC (stomatin/prohibitin superfamily)